MVDGQYTDNDIMVIEKLIELSKHDGMTLEKAAKMIAQQIKKVNPDLLQEEAVETDLVPFHIKQQLQEQYSVMAQEINQSMLAMEKRLMQEFRDEVAASKVKKKSWWRFW